MCGVEAESAVEAAEKAIVSNEVEEDVKPSVLDDNVDRSETTQVPDV